MTTKQIASRIARLVDEEGVWFRDVLVTRKAKKFQVDAVGDHTVIKSARSAATKVLAVIEPGPIVLIDTYSDTPNDVEEWYGTVEIDGEYRYTTDPCEYEQDARWTAQDWVSFNMNRRG